MAYSFIFWVEGKDLLPGTVIILPHFIEKIILSINRNARIRQVKWHFRGWKMLWENGGVLEQKKFAFFVYT